MRVLNIFYIASLRNFFNSLAFIVFFLPLLFSCKTVSPALSYSYDDIPVEIMSEGKITNDELVRFFLKENPYVPREKLERLISIYREECAFEGVNLDIAFAQMCLETGFLRFSGIVTEDMNNFCGLGAAGAGQKGHIFPDERTGIRAHVQHLKGYGTADALKGRLVDPRYGLIKPKGKAPDIFSLAGTWAVDPEYGTKLFKILERMYMAAPLETFSL